MKKSLLGLTLKIVVVIWVNIFIQNCGSREEPVAHKPKIPNKSSLPTKENFEEWSELWDGRSWIIANNSKNITRINAAAIKRNLAAALQKSALYSFSSSNIFDFSHKVYVEILEENLGKKIENISGFTAIVFPEYKNNNFHFFAPFLGDSDNSVTKKNLLTFEWNTLAALEDIAWFEPSLQSELYDYTFPPELNTASRVSTILKRVRVDAAWQYSLNAQNLPRFEYDKRQELNWTNVAVIDTGVDYLHSDLYDSEPNKSRIFINPKETFDGIDNDGNGYIDDIHGIDASIDIEEWNRRAQSEFASKNPQMPGPADVGGAGNPCPHSPDPTLEAPKRCGHGTHVAGLIAAKPGGEGADAFTLGICPSCRILPIRVSGNEVQQGISVNTTIDDIAQIRAIKYILALVDPQGKPYVQIVNMSLGKYFVSRSLAFWFRRLYENNIFIVAAAGNDDTDTPSYPAAYNPVLSVCAMSENATRGEYGKAVFSNFGSWVDICAPGTSICSILPGPSATKSSWCSDPQGSDGVKSGTSQAAPIIAGAAGLIKSIYPDYTPAQITELLLKFANAEKVYFDPNLPSDINKMNVLYSGWFANKTRYFLLGAGMLDLGATATEGKSCNRNVAECKSFVFNENLVGLSSQLKDGCVVSSTTITSYSHILASMPFLLVQCWLLFCFGKRFIRSKKL